VRANGNIKIVSHKVCKNLPLEKVLAESIIEENGPQRDKSKTSQEKVR
jgi:hypothetical protein